MQFFWHKLLNLQLALILGWTAALLVQTSVSAEEVYGPTNMLKTLHNPFRSAQESGNADNSSSSAIDSPISIDEPSNESVAAMAVHNLSQRFAAPILYLPGHLIMGKPAEFVVKGKPDYYTALAMADKDSGAKPIYGQVIHVGADRKVVSVGKIPKSGLLHLWIEAPFEGDMVGLPFYFVAAVWSNEDFSDLQIAIPVKGELEGTQAMGNFGNGVAVSASEDMVKKDPFVVHETNETTMQHMQYAGPHLDSGPP